MDTTNMAVMAVSLQQAALGNNLQMAMVKSVLESQAQATQTLLDTAASISAQAGSNPAHLGNLVDTLA